MRFWVFSRRARNRLTVFAALTLIAVLAVMAASIVLQNPAVTQATTPESLSTAAAPVDGASDANPLGP